MRENNNILRLESLKEVVKWIERTKYFLFFRERLSSVYWVTALLQLLTLAHQRERAFLPEGRWATSSFSADCLAGCFSCSGFSAGTNQRKRHGGCGLKTRNRHIFTDKLYFAFPQFFPIFFCFRFLSPGGGRSSYL